jgi:predicted kinase
MLLLVNGPPGAGKSTVARRYADDHVRSLVVEIDDLRTRLGGWSDDEESKQLARDLATDLIAAHLRRGYDVVVPQYVGRPEFRDRLRELATDLGVTFVEACLVAPVDLLEARFRDRRCELAGTDHPQADLADDAIGPAIADAVERLQQSTVDGWTRVIVDAAGNAAATYDGLVRALADRL